MVGRGCLCVVVLNPIDWSNFSPMCDRSNFSPVCDEVPYLFDFRVERKSKLSRDLDSIFLISCIDEPRDWDFVVIFYMLSFSSCILLSNFSIWSLLVACSNTKLIGTEMEIDKKKLPLGGRQTTVQ